MSNEEFAYFQIAMAYVFGPIIQWMIALFLAMGFMAASFVIWLGMLRRLSKA